MHVKCKFSEAMWFFFIQMYDNILRFLKLYKTKALGAGTEKSWSDRAFFMHHYEMCFHSC